MAEQIISVETANDRNFTDFITLHDRVMVKYHATWCGSCKLFAPKFRRLSEDPRYALVKFIEVNAEENQVARRMAGVDNLPFFATFRNGDLLDATATTKEETVTEMLNKLLL